MVWLKAEKLSKEYCLKGNAPLQILQDIDFEIGAGDRVAILGKSGAGKSTLLHILGTLERPTGGKVYFEGKDVFKLSDSALSSFRNQTLGFVFQFHYLLLEFSALENVMMPAILANWSRTQARERALGLLERVGLKNRAHHKPSELSGGEQSRVAIARALVLAPKLLLTDEMTGNLDPVTGQNIFELILSLQREYQMALVSVTHDTALAQNYPRVFSLEAGKLKAVMMN